jgi:CheY-like chemotaxis protein
MAVAEAKIKSKRDGDPREIIVMDDEAISENIVQVLDSFGCRTRRVESGDKAVQAAEKGTGKFFILDIHMGEKRENEGLNALEQIKSIDERIYVAVYSAHPHGYRQQAEKLGADHFQVKSTDVEHDMYEITAKMLPRALEEIADKSGDSDDDFSASKSFDKNRKAFRRLVENRELFEQHFHNYVGFVNGELVHESRERSDLLTFLRTKYPTEAKFYGFVEGPEDEVCEEVPSPLWIGE